MDADQITFLHLVYSWLGVEFHTLFLDYGTRKASAKDIKSLRLIQIIRHHMMINAWFWIPKTARRICLYLLDFVFSKEKVKYMDNWYNVPALTDYPYDEIDKLPQGTKLRAWMKIQNRKKNQSSDWYIAFKGFNTKDLQTMYYSYGVLRTLFDACVNPLHVFVEICKERYTSLLLEPRMDLRSNEVLVSIESEHANLDPLESVGSEPTNLGPLDPVESAHANLDPLERAIEESLREFEKDDVLFADPVLLSAKLNSRYFETEKSGDNEVDFLFEVENRACPISMGRKKIPVIGAQCMHRRSFCLFNMQQLAQQYEGKKERPWMCPICKKDCQPPYNMLLVPQDLDITNSSSSDIFSTD